jgi:hypothetical protein
MKLSNAATTALLALSTDSRLVISTLRSRHSSGEGDDWRADVAMSEGARRFTVPINTFRKMRRDGLVSKRREWDVTSDLIHSEYELTESGRAALD